MPFIIHGDNPVLSRQALHRAKADFRSKNPQSETIVLNGQKLSLTGLTEASQSPSLYPGQRLLVIENLFRCPSKSVLAGAVSLLSEIDLPCEVVVWESKTLTASQLKKLPQFLPQLFKSSSVTFKFLDQLYPKNAPRYLPLLKTACTKDTAELVFHLIVRQLRLLLTVSDLLYPIPPWQAQKLKRQSSLFGQSKLLSLHSALTGLDWRSKSGQTVGTFESELQQILITLV